MRHERGAVTIRRMASRDRVSSELRGFGLGGGLAMAVILLLANVVVGQLVALPVGAVLVFVWARLTGTPWGELGFSRPQSWTATVILGVLFGVALELVMKAVVLPLFGMDPVNHAFHFLVGNRAALPLGIYVMLEAGFTEEIVFRGFLFERLGKLFGPRPWATPVIVAATSLLFALGHLLGQEPPAALQAGLTGLIFGSIYARVRRIWFVMIAHSAFDLTALWIIHRGLETRIAHFVFH